MKSSKHIMMVLVAIALTGCEDNPERKPVENVKEYGQEQFNTGNSNASITKPADRRNIRITMGETFDLAKWGGSDLYEWKIEPRYGYVVTMEGLTDEFTFYPIHPGECKITLVDIMAITNGYDYITVNITY